MFYFMNIEYISYNNHIYFVGELSVMRNSCTHNVKLFSSTNNCIEVFNLTYFPMNAIKTISYSQ